MSRLVEKVTLPIYGELYVACAEDASLETIQSLQKPLKKLYEFEQEEENGTLSHFPCELGERLFAICNKHGYKHIMEVDVKEISIGNYMARRMIQVKVEPVSKRGCVYKFYDMDFGKVIFHLREEAEKELKGMDMEELNASTD